jgi:putative ABC transport system permease protein
MNFLKRAFLSITRRPGKSLILFLVVLIIGNLIAGTVAVRQAGLQSEEIAKRSLGTSASIGTDEQALMKAWEAGEEVEIGALTTEIIEELGARPEVRNFDYTLNTYLTSHSLKNYQPISDSDSASTDVAVENNGEAAHFFLRGIRYAPILLMEEGKLSLVEGRVFTEEDIVENRMVAVIPDAVAQTNGLHVGDTVVLTSEVQDYTSTDLETGAMKTVDSRDIALEVIGIFTLNSAAVDLSTNDSEGFSNSAYSSANSVFQYAANEMHTTIYVPIKVAQAEDEFMNEGYRKIAEKAGEELSETTYQPYYTPVYILKSSDDLKSFEQAANEVLPAYCKVLFAQSQYDQIAAPIQSIQKIMTVALVVAIVAALVIISLVTVLFLRDRRQEFGIYLSLGIRKPVIVCQVLAEVLVVAVAALLVALFTGGLISESISQQMINSQLAAQDSGSMYSSGFTSSYVGNDVGMLMGDLSLDDVLKTYQVGLSVPYALTFLGLGLGCVVLSCIAPLLYMLNLKPKKILM